jgi:preprotein translocase subunit SecD
MNRYPLWKNATVLIALVLGLLYTLPNFFGEAPAVQVASVKATHKVDARLMSQVEAALKAPPWLRRAWCSTSTAYGCAWPIPIPSSRPRTPSRRALNPVAADASYSVALNLVSEFSQLADAESMRCRCISASTCVVACISCCRWT